MQASGDKQNGVHPGECIYRQCDDISVQKSATGTFCNLSEKCTGKPGNVREFGTCQGNVRDVVNSQGIVREKIL